MIHKKISVYQRTFLQFFWISNMNIRAMMGYLLILFYFVRFELVLCIIILITLNA